MRKRNLFRKQAGALFIAASLALAGVPAAAAEPVTESQEDIQQDQTQDTQQETEVDVFVEEDPTEGEAVSPAPTVVDDGTGQTDAFTDSTQEESLFGSSQEDTFGDGEEEASDEDLDYIKGRPLTEEEKEEQLAPFQTPSSRAPSTEIYSNLSISSRAAYPSKFDSRELGYVTTAKDQYTYNICWAFATTSVMETAILSGNGALYDLSEEHLAYFFANRRNDPLGNTYGDKNIHATNYHDGGNSLLGALFLSTWSGMATEAQVPLYENTTTTPAKSLAYATTGYMTDAVFSDYSINRTKELLSQYYAVTVGIKMQNAAYYNEDTAAYCYPSSDYAADHEVVIVGWDDNYSKNNFAKASSVSSNGAWIAKNSWGDSWGDDGFFYISYEDASLVDLVAYKATDSPVYNHNYFYDGTSILSGFNLYPEEYIANVFMAEAGGSYAEALGEVTVGTFGDGNTFGIQVYTNLTDPSDPTSGTPAFSSPVIYRQTYAGISTVSIPEVILKQNSFYSVVVQNLGSNDVPYMAETSENYGWIAFQAETGVNQSFLGNSGGWLDLNQVNTCARIKAHTRTLKGVPADIELSLGAQSAVVTLGKKISLSASVTPSSLGYTSFTYESSDPSVATVSSTGRVTGVSVGTAYITCTSNDMTSLKVQCKVSVRPVYPADVKVKAKTYCRINVTWSAVADCSRYVIYRQAEGGTREKLAVVSGQTSYADKTAKTGVTYTYSVRGGVNVGGSYIYSGYSKTASAATVLSSPVFTVRAASAVYNKVSWEAVPGASGYRVYRKTPSGKWTRLTTITKSTTLAYNDKTAEALASYYYMVRAYRVVDGKRVYSSYLTPQLIKTAPAKQAISSVASRSNGILLRWSPQDTCDGYRIMRKTADSSWVKVAYVKKGSTSQYVDTTAKKGVRYTYAVLAYSLESYGRVFSKYDTRTAIRK